MNSGTLKTCPTKFRRRLKASEVIETSEARPCVLHVLPSQLLSGGFVELLAATDFLEALQ